MVTLLLIKLQLLDLLFESTVLFFNRVAYDLGNHFFVRLELLRVG